MTTPSESSTPAAPPAGGATPANPSSAHGPLLVAGLAIASFALIAFLIFWLQIRSAVGHIRSAVEQFRSPAEWEYLVHSHSELTKTGGLAERGLEKWELVSVEGGQERSYYFKRLKSAKNPVTARIMTPIMRWSGNLPADLAKLPAPQVKGPKSWAALWKAFKQPGEVPPVDFSKEFILVATTTGNHVNLTPVLYHSGIVRVSIDLGGFGAAQNGAFVIIVVSREGVKTLDGEPLPAGGADD